MGVAWWRLWCGVVGFFLFVVAGEGEGEGEGLFVHESRSVVVFYLCLMDPLPSWAPSFRS